MLQLVDEEGPDPKRESRGFDPITYQTKVPSIYVAGDVIGAPAWRAPAWSRAAWPRAAPLASLQDQARSDSSAGIFDPGDFPGQQNRRCKTQIFRMSSARTNTVITRGQIIGDTEDDQNDLGSPAAPGVHVIGEIAGSWSASV
jgi:hypothetical protein